MSDKPAEQIEAPSSAQNADEQNSGNEAPKKSASRLDRIRKKIKSLRGNDPDIYPMW